MKMKGIIFDLDGVICTTDHYHYLAWKALADNIGVYFDEKINNRLRGVSRKESLEIILERSTIAYSEEEKDKFCDEKNRLYVKMLEKMTPKDLSKEVESTLNTLRERGYLLAIGSSSRNAKYILERLGLEDYFDAVSDGTNISRSKPDPEVFIKAAQMLQLPCETCLVVEDAQTGIEAAENGGFLNAGIGEAALCKKTTYPLHTFSDLLFIL